MKGREVYKPFHYPKAFEYFEKQQQAHWLPTEVAMASDINDWKTELNEVERSVVGNVLKGFTQAEIHVEDYWSRKVANTGTISYLSISICISLCKFF